MTPRMLVRDFGQFLMKWLVVVGLVAGSLLSASPALANSSCYYTSNPKWVGTQWSSKQSGAPVTLTLNYLDTEGCLKDVQISFVGNFQVMSTVQGSLSRNGTQTQVTATWTPVAGKNQIVVRDTVLNHLSSDPNWKYDHTRNYNTYDLGEFTPPAAPSAPTTPRLESNNRTITVGWAAPVTNPGAVATYSVKHNQSNQVICNVPGNTFVCTIGNQPDGDYSFTITATNSQGAGANTATGTLKIGPPSKPFFSQTTRRGKTGLVLTWPTATGTTAIPAVYRVTDGSGKEVCGIAVSPSDLSSGQMSCQVVLTPKPSQYKLRVETALGAAESDLSSAFKARK
jgi:hypothetical protein